MSKGLYNHLSHSERRIIAQRKFAGDSLRQIAQGLQRSVSTISRELRRNQHDNGHHTYYTHSIAQRKADGRRHRCKPHPKHSPEQWTIITGYIRRAWSPEQVSSYLKIRTDIRVSHETIYQYIYADRRIGGHLHTHLRHRFRRCRKRYRSNDCRGILRGKTMINERPQNINDRCTIGHWEADTVLGSGRHCIATLVERKSGFVTILRLQSRTVKEMNTRLIDAIRQSGLPFISITSDNGTEFHGYADIEHATNTKFYFANPHHAWERGTNENTNGLIRQYLPKGMDMKYLTQKRCDSIANTLNTRPRKRHQYRTPVDVVFSHN
jgi:transposase, IS30 family